MKMYKTQLHVVTHTQATPETIPKLLTGFSVVYRNMQDVP